MEGRRNNLLLDKEETWRLKSRATWMESGDDNTKLFHAYASARRNSNSIWFLKYINGNLASEDATLQKTGKKHFSDVFMDDMSTNIGAQLRVIRLFLTFTQDEEVNCFLEPITIQEVEAVLKGFKKDKSPGPDRWPIEFFLAFFDLIGEELTSTAEQARVEGYVSGSINSTFFTLIPKCENPSTFADFRPISLCNIIYKVIS